jgi:hypothetical protein
MLRTWSEGANVVATLPPRAAAEQEKHSNNKPGKSI